MVNHLRQRKSQSYRKGSAMRAFRSGMVQLKSSLLWKHRRGANAAHDLESN